MKHQRPHWPLFYWGCASILTSNVALADLRAPVFMAAAESAPSLQNPSFEQGLLGWSAEGDAFREQPTYGENVITARVLDLPLGGDYWREVTHGIGIQGDHWIGTFERRPDRRIPRGTIQGDRPTGTLISAPFRLNSRYLTFLIGGGEDLPRLRVELLSADERATQVTQRTLRSATGHGDDRLRREVWDLAEYQGALVQLRVVDRSSSLGGHLNVDDFKLTNEHPAFTSPPQVVTSTLGAHTVWLDNGAPLWGFADLHTHPMGHLGFSGKLLHGAPDGNIEQALGDCECTHGPPNLNNRCGNYIRMALISQVDGESVHKSGLFGLDHDHRGYPDFKSWPHFTTVTHQQMWHEWLRRSWQGGLRVIVGLAVNNQLLAEGLDGELPSDDRRTVDLQLDAMKAFAERHADFLEIATSPSQLREIVQRGKLALVLGVEVDNLGNFNFADVDRSESAVRAEIHRLYDQGVRYIFPIHLTDNSFGGTAVAMDLFNAAQRFNQVQPLPENFKLWAPGDGFEIESASEDPSIRFHLNAPLDDKTVRTLRLALQFLEAFPFPFTLGHYPTVGGVLRNEREYQILKQFFLVPTPIASIPGGHRNRKGLTPLGRFAIQEMMRLGMLIDVDHESEHAVEEAISLARQSADQPGYPLTSGHNSFRTLGYGVITENQRSDRQLEQLRALRGMMGVGTEYQHQAGPAQTASAALKAQGTVRKTRSQVEADCGGSSKTFAQNYLYAVEKMGAVAFGTDANGMVKGPGPRFGKESTLRGNFCPPERQQAPVRYKEALGAKRWDGPNQALEPLKTGNRTWDINTDGVAHYGLLPDFLQDLRNVGVSPEDLSPLFSGAENFAQIWERTLRASASVK